jgi:REP element-mobilizing transposase RayT
LKKRVEKVLKKILFLIKQNKLPVLPHTDTFNPASYYHLFNHAVGNENLFRNDNNYKYFLAKFKQYITPVCKVYAYCLMPNHFHFLVQIKTEAELLLFCKEQQKEIIGKVDFHKIVMNQYKYMFNGYAQAYNKMYSRKGALFIDYLRRKEITDNQYFTKLVQYIHNNPVHHNFCKTVDEWNYSSYHTINSQKPTNIERSTIIDWFGSIDNYKVFHQQPTSFLNEIEL